MAFITTPYISEADATTYFTGKLNTDCWDDATSADRTAALIQATRAIDRLNFHGIKTDEDQTRQFPRNDDTTIPDDIQAATAEEALQLLEGKDPEMERESLAIVKQKFLKVEVNFDREAARPIYILHGIMSATAWAYILPYLRDPLTMKISRTT